jgi:hypothetical protein
MKISKHEFTIHNIASWKLDLLTNLNYLPFHFMDEKEPFPISSSKWHNEGCNLP